MRIMSIHKSKGLEFDTVVVLGVEKQTFWGEADAERSAFFVGISRAKRRLLLTVCEQREPPDGAKYWKVFRAEHDEFVGYAAPYLYQFCAAPAADAQVGPSSSSSSPSKPPENAG